MTGCVLTLLSPATQHLPLPLLNDISTYLSDMGIPVTDGPVWIAAPQVARFMISAPLRPDHFATIQLMADGYHVDALCLPVNAPKPRLFLADMDSTMIEGETLDDLAAFAGVRDEVAALTARAMDGSMDYREALALRLDLIKGTGSDTIEKVRAAQIFSPGAMQLITGLKAHGVVTVLVSGGFTVFTEPVARALGFHHHHGNTLDLDADGRVTGRVVEPLIHHAKKREILLDYCKKMNISPDQAIATGDGANDIPMMQTAGYGIAYHPKPSVRNVIANQIRHTDLTSILYAVGFAPPSNDMN